MRRIVLVLIFACLVAIPTFGTHAQGTGTTYTVQPGDNLYRISLKFGVTVPALQQANGIANASLIYAGQVLQIPAGGVVVPPTAAPGATAIPGGTVGTYVVQPGDTLARIAARFGTNYIYLAQLNGIANPSLIFAGQVLNVPGGTINPGGPTPTPGGPATLPLAGFELGGQTVGDVSGGTQSTMQSAKMKWVKRQISAGDGNGPNWINQAHSAGFKILLSVIGDKNAVTDGGYQTSYANYVAGLARSGADALEIWNEMNIDREWPTGQINPAIYVNLLAKSFSAIKGANGNTIVISGALAPTGAEGAFGLSRVWNDDRYYNGLAAAGAARYADCIGVHYNEGIISPTQSTGDPRGSYPTRYFGAMLNRALAPFPGKVACYTELGYLSREGYPPLPSGFEWAANTTVAQQAQWLGEATRIAASSGRIRLLIVFNVDATNYGADPQAGYAIIRPGGGCPACAQLAAAIP
ncbi:MAG: LysM peptidoglycan-binding domain-containing protein [Chloroflexota bacterium]